MCTHSTCHKIYEYLCIFVYTDLLENIYDLDKFIFQDSSSAGNANKSEDSVLQASVFIFLRK